MARTSGDNSHGNQNELNIVNSLNNKKYKELDLNLKKFVGYICDCEGIEINLETQINSEYETNNKKKQDIYISIMNKTVGVSMKMGGGNSTHQEKCEDFVRYASEELGASQEVCDDLRIFTWCDGTTDGTGDFSERMNIKQYKLRYADGLNRIRKFVEKNKRKLIDRSLFVGKYNSRVDYIYHGTPLNGKWIAAKEIIDFQINNPKQASRALIDIGRMSMQVWNRSLNGNNEHKRGEIQIKYDGLSDDLEYIMHSETKKIGTFEGNQEEFNISKIMNKNKNHKFWKYMNLAVDNKDLYVIKVDNMIYSALSKKKVKTKTDAYVINASIDDKFLLEREYTLTEKNCIDIDYQYIDGTGISIKKSDSKSYTYEKLSFNSFVELFKDKLEKPEFIFCGLTLYQEEKKMGLNLTIINKLGLKAEEVIEYFKSKTGEVSINVEQGNDVKKIRDYCEKEIRSIISDNEDIREKIFTGKGCFGAPYYIDYIYKNGELNKNIIPENYMISNGSGRSKGKYTIIFKPKGTE